MAGKIFGLARATCFTNGEIGTGNAEFSEPDEVNIFCLNFAFRDPNSELNGGSDVFCLAAPPSLTQKDRRRLPRDSHPSKFQKTLSSMLYCVVENPAPSFTHFGEAN